MDRKRKKEVIEYVVGALDSIRPRDSKQLRINVVINDCCDLLYKYYREEFATEIANETQSVSFMVPDYLSDWWNNFATQCTHGMQYVDKDEHEVSD